MNETNPPLSKRGPDMLEAFGIPDQPDVPPSSKHHFSKEGFIERLLGTLGNPYHVRTMVPINLKVCPYSSTEIALEEEVISGLQMLGMAKHTLRTIVDVPMSFDQHILCIEMIHDHQPSKNFC